MARKSTRKTAKRSNKAAAKRAGSRTAKKPAKRAANKSRKQTGRARGKQSLGSRLRSTLKRAMSGPVEPKNLGDLFHETLKDMYHAEKQLVRALPKMARAADSDELRKAFETHARETQGHVARLEQIFELSGKRPQTKTCHAILGLVEEGEEIMQEFKGSDALDAGLLAAAQAVEHYEISRYGTLKSWAEQHEMHDVARLLDETLGEEKRTDDLLTGIAEGHVNRQAEAA